MDKAQSNKLVILRAASGHIMGCMISLKIEGSKKANQSGQASAIQTYFILISEFHEEE
jgi:hypothetical protein